MTEDHQASSNSVVSTNATGYAANFIFPILHLCQTKYSEIEVYHFSLVLYMGQPIKYLCCHCVSDANNVDVTSADSREHEQAKATVISGRSS